MGTATQIIVCIHSPPWNLFFANLKFFNMRYISTALILSFFFSNAQAQLSKGTWLLGGTANLSARRDSYSSSVINSTSDVLVIKILPSIGYFLADKFSVGFRPGYTKIKSETAGPGGGNTNENRLDFGPFTRYYFLNADKPFNLLTDIGYQYGTYWFTPTKGTRHNFSASAGIAAFFNTSVAIEMLVGYYYQREKIRDFFGSLDEQTGLQITIGFQFHLEK